MDSKDKQVMAQVNVGELAIDDAVTLRIQLRNPPDARFLQARPGK